MAVRAVDLAERGDLGGRTGQEYPRPASSFGMIARSTT